MYTKLYIKEIKIQYQPKIWKLESRRNEMWYKLWHTRIAYFKYQLINIKLLINEIWICCNIQSQNLLYFYRVITVLLADSQAFNHMEKLSKQSSTQFGKKVCFCIIFFRFHLFYGLSVHTCILFPFYKIIVCVCLLKKIVLDLVKKENSTNNFF